MLPMSSLLVSRLVVKLGSELIVGLGGRNRKVAEAYVTQKKVCAALEGLR